MAVTASYTATASQFASAAVHLENAAEWRTVRMGTTRYVVMVSGLSGRVYFVRADIDGCQCRHYTETGRTCSHMLALHLSDLGADLAEAPVSLKSMRELFPSCAGGCGQVVEARDGLWCDDCSAKQERSARLAAGRAKVLAEWTS